MHSYNLCPGEGHAQAEAVQDDQRQQDEQRGTAAVADWRPFSVPEAH